MEKNVSRTDLSLKLQASRYDFFKNLLEVTKTNQNAQRVGNESKAIPYGLWDRYRERYNWRLQVEIPDKGLLKRAVYFHYNGEREEVFGETQIRDYPKIIPEALKWSTVNKLAVPSRINISWLEGNRYYCEIKFDEDEIFSAYKEISENNPNANIDVQIRINIPKTGASIKLINGADEIWLKKSNILVGKTKFTD